MRGPLSTALLLTNCDISWNIAATKLAIFSHFSVKSYDTIIRSVNNNSAISGQVPLNNFASLLTWFSLSVANMQIFLCNRHLCFFAVVLLRCVHLAILDIFCSAIHSWHTPYTDQSYRWEPCCQRDRAAGGRHDMMCWGGRAQRRETGRCWFQDSPSAIAGSSAGAAQDIFRDIRGFRAFYLSGLYCAYGWSTATLCLLWDPRTQIKSSDLVTFNPLLSGPNPESK